MGPDAVADDDDPDLVAGGTGGGDQATAAEALIVGMGRHHHETAGTDDLLEARQRQLLGGLQERVGVHASEPRTRRRRIHAQQTSCPLDLSCIA